MMASLCLCQASCMAHQKHRALLSMGIAVPLVSETFCWERECHKARDMGGEAIMRL